MRGISQRLVAVGRSRHIRSVAPIAVFGIVGVFLVVGSKAATPATSIEPEQGQLSGSVAVMSDAGASGGSAITFGASSGLNLPRIPWEGGPDYWKVSNGAQFAKADAAGWDDPNFFPITVFLGKPDSSHIASLKDAGINTFAPPEYYGPAANSWQRMELVSDAGMYAIAGSEWDDALYDNPNVVGWFISDECEMGMGECGAGDEYFALNLQQSWVNERRALNDGRFVQANFGNGILRTFWATNTMEDQVRMMDASSADKYTYTSPDVAGIIDGWHDAPDWPNGVPVARAYSYGWQADQMKRFQDPNKLRPIWTFVETAKPYLTEPDSREILPEEIEGAVWSALIHEARGISYFQHNGFDNLVNCQSNYSIVECPNVHAAVKAINEKVTSLAPVLNTQSYYNSTRDVNGFTYYYYSFDNGTDTMLKTYGADAYIFAGLGMRCNDTSCTSGTVDAPGSKTFTLPDGVNGTTVEVVGESRTIPVVNGAFTDNFAAEYSNHVYKISLAGDQPFQANCIVKPSDCGYPDETNTGVPAGTVLTDSGSITVSQNGAIIENLNITGNITIRANSVTIRKVRITSGDYYPIDHNNGNTGLVIEDTEIFGLSHNVTAGISFGNFTARRVYIHGSADGIKADSNAIIEDSYITDLAYNAQVDTHNDGIQTTGGSNVTIRHNTCKLSVTPGANACIQVGTEWGGNSNWLVTNNLFDGGGWTINAGNGNGPNMVFTNNRFTRNAGYGPGGVPGATWTGNYFDDDGTAVE